MIIDRGMAFPDGDMFGVDLVIPGSTFIECNIDKICRVVITHGHEDHTGSLLHLLKWVSLLLYGTTFTLGLMGGELKERGSIGKMKMNVVCPGDTAKLDCVTCELIHVNHSISDSIGTTIYPPAGALVYTSDFRIDYTPAQGEMINPGQFIQLGKEGVLALLVDPINAERLGFTMTECKTSRSFENLFLRAEKSRVIIAISASSISRARQTINCTMEYGRKVTLSGRSMLNVTGIA